MACLYIQVCAQSNLEAPLPNIHAVTIANDHPTLHATAIAQDQMGALWISAYDRGLYRYFGHDYDHLLSSPDLPDGLCGNDIYTMSFDLKDQLWISTNTHSGVCIYDYQRKTFSQPVLLDGQVFPNMVWFILHDSLGQTWMGTSDGVFVYSEENGLVNIELGF